jgi:cytochrome c-type biogenesis protein CcmH
VTLPRLVSWAGVFVLVIGALVVGARPEAQPASPAARTDQIAAELRCPVCQGLSVLASDSSTARSIRQDIARRIGAGQSDAEIRQAYVDRYGDWILLRPRGRGFGTLVWALPVGAALAGVGGLGFALWRWRRRLAGRATPDDRLVVERAMRHELGGQP